MNSMMRPLVALFAAIVVAAPMSAHSQSEQRIAAVVNDEVISARDLRQRIRLVLFSSGIEDTADARRRVARQVLRRLIDERLQLQEAKKRNVAVSDEEIGRSVSDVEKRNGMQPNSLPSIFGRNRVSYDSLRAQYRAQIAWSKLVRRRLSPRIEIGTEEVEEILARLKAAEGEATYHLAEIFLSINGPDEEPAIRQTAERMVEQIRGGARFNALARQFSQAATAAVGGDLGWTPRSQLDPPIAAAIDRLSPGELLGPIRTTAGFRILALIGKRKIAAGDPNRAELDLKQIFLSNPDGDDPARRQARLELAGSEGSAIDGCGDLSAVAERLGAEAPQDLGKVKLAELSAEIQGSIANVAVGKSSRPMIVPGGIVLMVVCGRTLPKSELPSAETVTEQIRLQRLNLSAQRYLRDLRSAAIVDVRL